MIDNSASHLVRRTKQFIAGQVELICNDAQGAKNAKLAEKQCRIISCLIIAEQFFNAEPITIQP